MGNVSPSEFDSANNARRSSVSLLNERLAEKGVVSTRNSVNLDTTLSPKLDSLSHNSQDQIQTTQSTGNSLSNQQHHLQKRTNTKVADLNPDALARLQAERKKRQDLRLNNIRATYLDVLGLPPACCSQPNHSGIHFCSGHRSDNANTMYDFIDGSNQSDQRSTLQSFKNTEHDKDNVQQRRNTLNGQFMTPCTKDFVNSPLDLIEEVKDENLFIDNKPLVSGNKPFIQQRLLQNLQDKPLITSSGAQQTTKRDVAKPQHTKVCISSNFLMDDTLREIISVKKTSPEKPVLIDLEDDLKVLSGQKAIEKSEQLVVCNSSGKCYQCNTINCLGPSIDYKIKLQDDTNFRLLANEGIHQTINIEDLSGLINSTRASTTAEFDKIQIKNQQIVRQRQAVAQQKLTQGIELKRIPHRASEIYTENDLLLSNNVQHPPCLQINYSHVDHLIDEKEQAEKKNLKKTSDQIRAKLLSSLTYEKIWLMPGTKPKQYQTCIIFDWDDTIFCTTFLEPYQNVQDESCLSKSIQKKLATLDEYASQMLKLAKTKGQVFIVTNATHGWVEFTAIRFLPRVYEQIIFDIPVISARDKYGPQYPEEMEKWKLLAFNDLQDQLDKQAILNLIALGDQDFEMEAAYQLGRQFTQAFVKTVKFRVYPGPNELTQQIKLVMEQFDTICTSAKDLKVKLMKEETCCQQDQEKAQGCPFLSNSSYERERSSRKSSSKDKKSPSKDKNKKKKTKNMFQKRNAFF